MGTKKYRLKSRKGKNKGKRKSKGARRQKQKQRGGFINGQCMVGGKKPCASIGIENH